MVRDISDAPSCNGTPEVEYWLTRAYTVVNVISCCSYVSLMYHISTCLYYWICKIRRNSQICDLLLTPKYSKAFSLRSPLTSTGVSASWTPIVGLRYCARHARLPTIRAHSSSDRPALLVWELRRLHIWTSVLLAKIARYRLGHLSVLCCRIPLLSAVYLRTWMISLASWLARSGQRICDIQRWGSRLGLHVLSSSCTNPILRQ